MATYHYIASLLLIICGSSLLASASRDTLKSISVIFRHGDRTSEVHLKGLYPNDPYYNYTFEPMGYGGLTNNGKKREYQIGTLLRKRYNKFLGKTYLSSELAVVSTSTERTKMSLLLVLAGLYPPKDKQIWNKDINWQPIPINAIPKGVHTYMKPNECPSYQKELERVLNSEKYKKDVSRFHDLMKKLTILMGHEVNSTRIIYHLYHTLTSEKGMNLPLPKWTRPYYPKGLVINATILQYKTESYNTLLKKLNGGMMIRQFLNNMGVYNTAKKNDSPKAHLYSSHERNIAAILHALNLLTDVIPEYSSSIIFELHKINSKPFIKVVYYKGIPAEFETLIIPGCSEYCAVDDFLRINKDVLPDDVLEACYGPPENTSLIPESVNPIVWVYKKLREWFNM